MKPIILLSAKLDVESNVPEIENCYLDIKFLYNVEHGR